MFCIHDYEPTGKRFDLWEELTKINPNISVRELIDISSYSTGQTRVCLLCGKICNKKVNKLFKIVQQYRKDFKNKEERKEKAKKLLDSQ